jgi:hypothetical protein
MNDIFAIQEDISHLAWSTLGSTYFAQSVDPLLSKMGNSRKDRLDPSR